MAPMIADTAARPGSGYRDLVRSPSILLWPLLGVIVALLLSRVARPLGPLGIVVAFLLVMILLRVAWETAVLPRLRPLSGDGWRPGTKNVTPHEPALPPGATRPQGSAEAVGPTVIVVEQPDGGHRLAAKLEALDRLRADGLVTDEEYEAKRAKLIADF
jgi:hypothetical protein